MEDQLSAFFKALKYAISHGVFVCYRLPYVQTLYTKLSVCEQQQIIDRSGNLASYSKQDDHEFGLMKIQRDQGL